MVTAATAETPALAAAPLPQPSFDQAFEPFALGEAEVAPDLAAATVAQARFDAAPVRTLAPVSDPRGSAGGFIGSGTASYYGAGFAGRPTASGERFNPAGLTAAHRSLPFGTKLMVTNPRTGRSVVVRVNDRGPFHRGRVIDLSQEAARRIGLIQQGHGPVQFAAISS